MLGAIRPAASANSPPALTQAKETPHGPGYGISLLHLQLRGRASNRAIHSQSKTARRALGSSRIHYKAIKERLAAEDPSLDEQTLADTVEGLTNVHEILCAILRAAIADEALVTGLKGLIADMEDRRDRLHDRAAKRRQIVKEVMVELELKKLQAPDFTASIRARLSLADGSQRERDPLHLLGAERPKLDRATLIADFKLGRAVGGATLSNPEPVLSVRTR